MSDAREGNGSAPYGVPAPGFRLPAGTGVGAVRLQVSNLERSLTFYGDILGFGVLERGGARAALGADGAEASLIELHEDRSAAPVAPRSRLGLFHYAILLPDRADLGPSSATWASEGNERGRRTTG